MTQKQSLARALAFAERDADDDGDGRLASRASFVVLWLEDMNWHDEARALMERIAIAPLLQAEFDKLQRDTRRTSALQQSAALFNQLFGWTLLPAEWPETHGAKLIEELWELINAKP